MKAGGKHYTLALAGQPNVGKSTIFNMLTGARQHVANFPGVTVERKEGRYHRNGSRYHIVDLPGTYSLTSYSMEERVARDFILDDQPDLIMTTVDASNLERNLYLVLQIIEMGRPALIILNMMDIAKARGISIDLKKLSAELGGVPVVPTVGNRARGGVELKEAIDRSLTSSDDGRADRSRIVDYGEDLERLLGDLQKIIADGTEARGGIPARWAAVKLLEKDEDVRGTIRRFTRSGVPDIVQTADEMIASFTGANRKSPGKVIATQRYRKAADIIAAATQRPPGVSRTLTDRVDAVVLHRAWGPAILVAILFGFYEVTMNLGTRLADWFFPYLNRLREPVEMVFGYSSDLLRDNLLRSMVLEGVVAGIISILYYVPIFLVLFALIAILEDSGYMTRVAFIMDRVFRTFGLHGQSTLPLILGGVIVGGCAVPGVMATRAIKDEKARMITILIMPLMNCLAKIPFYILIVGMFFTAYQGLILFGISIFTFVTALLVAKLFSRHLIRGKSAPFVMELPAYHLPTVRGVLGRTIERTWLFVKKVITIVMAVMVLVWFFVLFPGLGFEKEAVYDARVRQAAELLQRKAGAGNPFLPYLHPANLPALMELSDLYRNKKNHAGADPEDQRAVRSSLQEEYGASFLLVNGGGDASGRIDAGARQAAAAFKVFQKELKQLKLERKKELIDHSYAATLGRFLEPITLAAGFNWKINVAVISTFAAKESLVGTLGMIYSAESGDSGRRLSESIRAEEGGWTVWHALAILILVALFPPCLATLIMIKTETRSYKWAGFAALYPVVLGFMVATVVFQLGTRLF